MMIPKANVILIRDYEDIPKGSRFDGELVNIQGAPYWEGMWGSMAGTYEVRVPEECCEVYDEQKHDPAMFYAKKVLDDRAAMELERLERLELARLKAKYEK